MTFHVEHSGLFATAMLYRERHNIRVLQKLGSPTFHVEHSCGTNVDITSNQHGFNEMPASLSCT